jgi:two-component system sensor histidine kinase/response regulator
MEKRKFTVLVVDDEPADVEILRRLLEEIEGRKIQLLACHDAETGRAEASHCRADLIFLDYLLGAETGLEVFQQIREEGCMLPVIMLTGHGSEEIAVEAMKAGVSDYLVKGRITPDSLRLVISNALQKFEMQQKIDEQRATLLDAERQRVMMESVGAACHHFAQPLTTMLSNLEMLARDGAIQEPEKSRMLQQCLQAAEMMKMILNKFQQVNEYRTRPYLDDEKILDIGLESIYGTPPGPGDETKGQPKPEKQ